MTEKRKNDEYPRDFNPSCLREMGYIVGIFVTLALISMSVYSACFVITLLLVDTLFG